MTEINSNEKISLRRRTLIKLGAGASAAAWLGMNASAARALQTMALGEGEVTVVSDGHLVFPLSIYMPDAPQDELAKLYEQYNIGPGSIEPDCNVTFWKSGDKLVVFDAGSGPNFMPTAGKLVANMVEVGLDPADVTDVVFTHAHPDHIWGVTDDFDELVFGNATHHIGQAEWDFWSSDDAINQLPQDRQVFAIGAKNRLEAMADQVAMITPGDEVVPGVEAVATYGHTPGHMCYILHGNGEQILVGGDAIVNQPISFMHPEWPSGSDQDPVMGAQTRAQLLDRLAGDKVGLIGYHLPHPGSGRVTAKNGAFQFEAS